MVTSYINKAMTKIFGSRNDRLIKAYRKRVEEINALEPEIRKLTDAEMKARAAALKTRLHKKEITEDAALPQAFALMRESMDRNIGLRNVFNPDLKFDYNQLPKEAQDLWSDVKFKCTGEHDWLFVEIPVKLYDAIREVVPADKPPYRARPFDVQLIGGMVLFEGRIAEMATGEGKTFVAPLACFLMALTGRHCHVVTVNEYLVQRDAAWTAPAFYALGMTVGYIHSFQEPQSKKRAYLCNVTYGTNSEFGFDYLRDNMKNSINEQVQGPLDYIIVDEVDSILIDEARTPLIISGPAHDNAPQYKAADEVVRRLVVANKPWDAANERVDQYKRKIKAIEGEIKNEKKENIAALNKQLEEARAELIKLEEKLSKETRLYEVEIDRKAVHLTHEGIQLAQQYAGVGSFYVGNNMDWPHLLEQSLRAHVVYQRDKEYVVHEGEIVIVDEFTGRLMVGRQWSDGLHQAVEAKERVQIKPETQTMATVTLQNFYKLYKRGAGMTGTAMTEAEEFMKIYKLDVVKIPTNRAIVREDQNDLIFMSEKGKWNAIVEQIKEVHDKGQPVLVGTTSVEKSERLSQILTRRYGIEHEVLNAKNHAREADIIAMAGQQFVNKLGNTVGRVTIATNMAGRGTDIKLGPDITEVGGLYVLGTERHESRRIDNQLRGRSGRQGDPGVSRFYLSLEDDLMKMFAGDTVLRALKALGMKDDEPIEHRFVSRAIERAQKKVEERNFGIRKNLLEYDEVRDVQRNYFYKQRQQIIEGRNLRDLIFEIITAAVDDAVARYLDKDYVPNCVAEWARGTFNCVYDPQDLRDTDAGVLELAIKEHARDEARSSITTSLDEFMDPDREQEDWDFAALSKWALESFGVQMGVTQLSAMSREQIRETFIDAAMDRISQRDISGVSKFLEKNFAQRQLADWVNNKFEVDIKVEDLIGKTPEQAAALMLERATAIYEARESEYPIEYALEVTLGGGGTENIYASEQLATWLQGKYNVAITGDNIRSMSVPELHKQLVKVAKEAPKKIEQEIDLACANLKKQEELLAWASARFHTPADKDFFEDMTDDQIKSELKSVGNAFLRSELTELERGVLLSIYDTTWKDHLYGMDQLRDTINLRGFAEKDPRIEFKKEGSSLFREFQRIIRDKVTDIIFKVRLNQQFVMKNVYTNPVEEFAPPVSTGVADSPAVTAVSAEGETSGRAEEREPEKVKTIVNETEKVGANDPCPCGSGKKYKKCCGRA